MSKDIRSFFSKKPKQDDSLHSSGSTTKATKKKPVVLSSDDETVPSTPEPKIQKKRRIISDSDDENTTKKTKKIKSDTKASSSKSKTRAPVKASDIFGSEPVKRSEIKAKKKSAVSIAEAEIHLDDDFNKTLMQLDEETIIMESPQVKTKHRDVKDHKTKSMENCKKTDSSDKDIELPIKTTPLKIEKKTPKKSPVEMKTPISTPKEKKPPISTPKDKKTPISTPKENKTPKIQKRTKSNDEDQENDMDPDEERFEKRRQSAVLYQKFLKRSGPSNPGSKEVPEGKPGCLTGLVFVITGILESLERDEAAQIIKDLGGRVPGQISGKVTHLVLGEDAGPAKLAKAESMNIKILSEDDLLDLIREKSGIPTKKAEKRTTTEASEASENKKVKIEKKSPKDKDKKIVKSTRSTPKKDDSKPKEIKKEKETPKKYINKTLIENTIKEDSKTTPEKNGFKSIPKKVDIKNKRKEIIPQKPNMKTENVVIPRTTDEHYDNIHSIENLAWVDKHKPTSCKQIIGQQGSSSNCAKLMNWLSKWHVNHNGKTKLVKPSPWAKSDDGAYFKAALLSGSPGVGKTTTASLVCKELGFDTVEFNASDTRSKKLLKDQISELLSNTSLHGYFNGGNEATSKKHVLIMDEVDGMAGNEDRGGLQELINLIKNASVPVICMCNDRNHPKMRTLVNYCYDLRFNKPRLDQIKGAMMSICFKEGVKITPDALSEIITGANQDIRQILNHLSMWSADNKNINVKTASKEANSAKKDIKIGPWEVVRKVFSKEEHKTMTMQDKSDLFFHDYSLSPLFVQQNYLIVSPSCPKDEILKRVALAADSLSLGDLVDKHIRSSMAWSLLPTQAMFSSVLPGEYMCGHVAGQINFPGWLGKNSKRNKLLRMSSEVYSHIKSKTTSSKHSIRLDYAKPLLDAITRPLIKDGTSGVVNTLDVLKEYQLLREDIESLQELNNWPGTKDSMTSVDGKVKAALTRAFNKELAPYSYSMTSVSKKKATTDTDELALLENEEDVVQDSDDDQENDNIENDALIKTKKKTVAKATASTSKGATRGKGRGKVK